MIEQEFLTNGIHPADAVFDPIPSYGGQWLFAINNLQKNAKSKELWNNFYNETYREPLKKIFQTERVLDLPVGMISKPNPNNIGRCLRYNKVDFFKELTSFLNQHIDNYGLSEQEKKDRVKELLGNIGKDNEKLNLAYSDCLSIRVKRLKNVLDNSINSEYFEAAMLDYEPFKTMILFDDYIKNNYEISSKFQVGMLKLGDFFDENVDFIKLYQIFTPDTFCLLFSKIIYDFNLMFEKEFGRLDNSYGYLCQYQSMVEGIVKNKDKRYDPSIKYEYGKFKKCRYTRRNFSNEFNKLMERHPEAGSFKVLLSDGDIEKYKDISLIEKLTLLYNNEKIVNWKFLPEGTKIKKGIYNNRENNYNNGKKYNQLIDELNMRITILENSGFIGRPIQGLEYFDGFFAFIYPNGKVILEKFWENINNEKPAYNTATYVMDIDNFVDMSKFSRSNLITFIKEHPKCGVKRIFHTTINNWQRNLYNEINGTYRLEDAIEFINGLNMGETRND